MKISEFLKDKIYLVVLALATSIITVMFLYAVRCNIQAIIVITSLFWCMIIAILLIEYSRRVSFYNNLKDTLESLNQKYLLAEIIDEPTFMDGAILFDTLTQVNKATMEYLKGYKQREQEYKEYVEMWVHEIKTPLAACKLIISNNENEVTKSIDEEIDHVERFVEQALFYARSTTLEKDYIIKEMSLKTSVNKVIRKYSKVFIYKKIKLEIDDIDKTVYCDSKWLEFILEQVISNCLKYTSEETGNIQINAETGAQSVTLTIEDNGIGIPASDVSKVFEKGFTGRNGRSNEKATGMGLYLCKQLCTKLYLDISLTSIEAKGTTVSIVFPLSSMMLLK